MIKGFVCDVIHRMYTVVCYKVYGQGIRGNGITVGIDSENPGMQSKFQCMSRGHADHADCNAFTKMLAFGIGARGEALSLEKSSVVKWKHRIHDIGS